MISRAWVLTFPESLMGPRQVCTGSGGKMAARRSTVQVAMSEVLANTQVELRAVQKNASEASLLSRVPSMIIDSEVKVLWEVGRNDPSEPHGEDRERIAERSG